MFSFCSSAAALSPTLSPIESSFTREIISIWPLLILVGMLSAWNQAVWPGSQPVGPGSTKTSTGAKEPTRAGAGLVALRIVSRTAGRSAFVKTRPTLPTRCSRMHAIGCLSFFLR